jgi:glycosyltransferase involved in cell wall biosynthesis
VLEDGADSKALADMLRTLLNDSALCDRLGAAAAETASHFSWELHALKMREFFEAAAQEKSGR